MSTPDTLRQSVLPHAVLAVIPARYASTRFPGKPLVDILGKPMIQHVWERVCCIPDIARVVIATDDERIRQAATAFGAEVQMTSPDHPSGTDRLWEVGESLTEYEWILNVQGDEPFIDPEHLQSLLNARRSTADILTLVTPIHSKEDWHNPNIVKAVLSSHSNGSANHVFNALYFSRAAVPFARDWPNDEDSIPSGIFRHLGLYLYRRSALQTFVKLPVSPLEALEKLEQLRALDAGLSIAAVSVPNAPIGVDTPEDLSQILQSSSIIHN